MMRRFCRRVLSKRKSDGRRCLQDAGGVGLRLRRAVAFCGVWCYEQKTDWPSFFIFLREISAIAGGRNGYERLGL